MPTSAGTTGANDTGSVAKMPAIEQPLSSVNNPQKAYVVRELTVDKPPMGTSVWGVATVGGGGAGVGTPGGTPTPSSGQIFPTGRA